MDLHPVIEWTAAALIVLGSFFLLVGAIGLVRLPDFYMRLHAPTKASTLGVGSVLLASLLLGFGQGRAGVAELLITLFVFLTAPVSANLLAQAALHMRLPSRASVPEECVRPAARIRLTSAECRKLPDTQLSRPGDGRTALSARRKPPMWPFSPIGQRPSSLLHLMLFNDVGRRPDSTEVSFLAWTAECVWWCVRTCIRCRPVGKAVSRFPLNPGKQPVLMDCFGHTAVSQGADSRTAPLMIPTIE